MKLYYWLRYILFAFIYFLVAACKKGQGAICRDGWRSHSTGSGTCSWHGGVDYYLDPDEIAIGKTIGLAVFIIIVIFVIRFFRKVD